MRKLILLFPLFPAFVFSQSQITFTNGYTYWVNIHSAEVSGITYEIYKNNKIDTLTRSYSGIDEIFFVFNNDEQRKMGEQGFLKRFITNELNPNALGRELFDEKYLKSFLMNYAHLIPVEQQISSGVVSFVMPKTPFFLLQEIILRNHLGSWINTLLRKG